MNSQVQDRIELELEHQQSLADTWMNKNHPTLGEEILLMEEYMMRARRQFTFGKSNDEATDEIIKVVAMGIRCLNHEFERKAK